VTQTDHRHSIFRANCRSPISIRPIYNKFLVSCCMWHGACRVNVSLSPTFSAFVHDRGCTWLCLSLVHFNLGVPSHITDLLLQVTKIAGNLIKASNPIILSFTRPFFCLLIRSQDTELESPLGLLALAGCAGLLTQIVSRLNCSLCLISPEMSCTAS
jgi:hypothetical protein